LNLLIEGLPGSGKSLISEILSKDFGYNLIEVEKVFEIEAGTTLCDVVKHNGFQKAAHVERKILERFRKGYGRIILGCGMIDNFILDNFLVVYLKIPKERFLENFQRCSSKSNLEAHYNKFHRFLSTHADLVISVQHKMKFEICVIIDDFFKKNIIHKQNT
jgi:shikimate kinase